MKRFVFFRVTVLAVLLSFVPIVFGIDGDMDGPTEEVMSR